MIYLLKSSAKLLARCAELRVHDCIVRSVISGTAPFVGFANHQAVLANPTPDQERMRIAALIEFVDSEIFTLLEAMAWELGRRPQAALAERYRALVARSPLPRTTTATSTQPSDIPANPPGTATWSSATSCTAQAFCCRRR